MSFAFKVQRGKRKRISLVCDSTLALLIFSMHDNYLCVLLALCAIKVLVVIKANWY